MSSGQQSDLVQVPRRQRPDEVRRQLEEAIVSGRYAPGDRLPSERELVALFGVSRLSVREGIKSLIGLGLVQARHGRGYFVAGDIGDTYRSAFGRWLKNHSHELADLYEVRGALTTLAARHALRRNDSAAIEAIERAHAAFAEAVETGGSPADLVELDVQFHRQMARASGSELIAGLLDDLYANLEEPRQAIMALPRQPERSAQEHQAIVTSLHSGDIETVARAIDAHIESICQTIATHSEPGLVASPG
jgi:GntR family transcriptional regulator, transcriptional repressor for pyruvate dehydrogenase complex